MSLFIEVKNNMLDNGELISRIKRNADYDDRVVPEYRLSPINAEA
jgi:hypothetical protein